VTHYYLFFFIIDLDVFPHLILQGEKIEALHDIKITPYRWFDNFQSSQKGRAAYWRTIFHTVGCLRPDSLESLMRLERCSYQHSGRPYTHTLFYPFRLAFLSLLMALVIWVSWCFCFRFQDRRPTDHSYPILQEELHWEEAWSHYGGSFNLHQHMYHQILNPYYKITSIFSWGPWTNESFQKKLKQEINVPY